MSWFKNVFHRRDLYRDLSEEMVQHIEERAEQIMKLDGVSREEAELRARRSFGNTTLIEEQGRETWQWLQVENLIRDVRFSARLLRRSPGFTLIAILTLTLGIGANTAVFSLLNGLLLRPLPVPRAQELVILRLSAQRVPYSFCAPLARALEKRRDVFRDVFAFSTRTLQLRGANGNEPVDTTMVSGQFFDGMSVAPQLGRALSPSDDRVGSANGAVISDGFWKTHFQRDPAVLGKTMVLNGVSFSVVGVMPAGFIGADATRRPDIYIPLSAEPLVDAPYDNIAGGYHSWWLRMGARLNPNVSLEQANAALKSNSTAVINEAIPDPKFEFFSTKRDSFYISAEPGAAGYSSLRTQYRSPLLVTFGLCVLVLLLACVNLASLLLARSASREREIATRLAIGATRRRLIQQLMIDSLLLAALGAAAGLAVAPFVSRLLVAMLTGGQSAVYLDASIDWRVMLFAVSSALFSTLLVGLLPAFQATAGNLVEHMKDGARSTGKATYRRLLPRVLLTLEIALAMLLVTGSGLLGSSLVRLYRTGLGFDPHNLLEVDVDPDRQPLEGAALVRMYHDIADRVAAQPGVRAVGYVGIPPLSNSMSQGSRHVPGGTDHDVWANQVSQNYFTTMRATVLGGRDFTWQDKSDGTANQIIINQAAAKLFFPGQDALGRVLNETDDKKETSATIVGIVADTKYGSLKEPAPPTVYTPIAWQKEFTKPRYTLMVRYDGPVAPIAASIRHILSSTSADIPAPAFRTMEDYLDESIAAERVMALLSIFFAISALLVTGIGLYGVLAYATARRTSEIGIRMALGAARKQVIALIFRENLWVALSGCAAGLVAAFFASRALATFLYGTSPRDPSVLIGSVMLLCLIAGVASVLPALRAANVDPMKALRSE